MDLKELFLSYTNDLHHKKVANFFFEAKNGERWARLRQLWPLAIYFEFIRPQNEIKNVSK